MEPNDISIVSIINREEKAKLVEEILLDLPEWFGLPESTKDYIEQSKSLLLFAAQHNQMNIGFITLKETSDVVCEIHCMGIKKEYHHKGIGKLLFNAFEEYAKEKYEFIQVKTVDEGHYKEYDQTLDFYKSVGFKKMEVFPKLWDEWNPCLIMIKYIQKDD
jgi:ribosomal protein S18 acetylase RimI-like enzyme